MYIVFKKIFIKNVDSIWFKILFNVILLRIFNRCNVVNKIVDNNIVQRGFMCCVNLFKIMFLNVIFFVILIKIVLIIVKINIRFVLVLFIIVKI